MKLDAAPRILIVSALCVLSLIGLVVNESMARASGAEVVLPMAAIDPRAVLSGHYVMVDLRYRLAPNQACPPNDPTWDWLALKPEGASHRVAGGASSLGDAEQVGPIPVKGSFTCSEPQTAPDGAITPGVIWIDLGIARYHVSQQEAQRIERIMRASQPDEATRVFAIVSVGRDGAARLKGLLVDGERLELSWL